MFDEEFRPAQDSVCLKELAPTCRRCSIVVKGGKNVVLSGIKDGGGRKVCFGKGRQRKKDKLI